MGVHRVASAGGRSCLASLAIALFAATPVSAANWPSPAAPAVPSAPGYVVIPSAAAPRDPAHQYRALFDAQKGPGAPEQKLAMLQRVGTQINGLVLANVPPGQIDFTIIFRGAAVDAILSDEKYRQKFGIGNPNLNLIGELERAGVRFLVCGQYMAKNDIRPIDLVAGVKVAEGATLVIINYANRQYAIISD